VIIAGIFASDINEMPEGYSLDPKGEMTFEIRESPSGMDRGVGHVVYMEFDGEPYSPHFKFLQEALAHIRDDIEIAIVCD